MSHMWPSLSSHLLWLVIPRSSCFPPPLLDVPRQKASTRPPIHGALPGRWFSLVILPCWATLLIWASMVPSLPSTPKTDWWALPSHLRFLDNINTHSTSASPKAFVKFSIQIICCLCFQETAATAPLPPKLPPAWQWSERGSSCWLPLWF